MKVVKQLILVLSLWSARAVSQDTLCMMHYNILEYDAGNSTHVSNMRNILQYVKPDIFVVNEINSYESGESILHDALNYGGINYYAKATYVDGPDTDNDLFYNSQKLSLKKQDVIPTALRNINEYILYYNNPSYLAQHDTVFLYVYAAHLKASTGYEQQRLQEVQCFKQHLAQHTDLQNIFFAGDMNFYNSYEPGLAALISPGPYQLMDPIDSIGDWHDNASYSYIHTQSTRTEAVGGGSTGGMDDRFDFIFINNDVFYGYHQLTYIWHTYKSLGNDGQHLNEALTALPLNPGIPESITNSLYAQSDHLPVVMKLYLNYDASTNEYMQENNEPEIFPNPSEGSLNIAFRNTLQDAPTAEIFSMNGQLIQTLQLNQENPNLFSANLCDESSGAFLLKISTQKEVIYKQLLILP